MNPIDRENQSDPELIIDIEPQPAAFKVTVRRGGNVRYVGEGFKTRDEAWEAGRVFVKNWLKAQIQASGIGRRGERPAFSGLAPAGWVPEEGAPVPAGVVDDRSPILCVTVPGGLAQRQAFEAFERGDAPPALEGERFCTCGCLDGWHEILRGPCRMLNCPCEGFEPVAQVEAVQ
jgi:hypothetical protein